jgi:hypothetical protein
VPVSRERHVVPLRGKDAVEQSGKLTVILYEEQPAPGPRRSHNTDLPRWLPVEPVHPVVADKSPSRSI